MNRTIRIVTPIVTLGVLALLLGWLYLGQAGATQLERWISTRLLAVLENYLVPEITFSDVDYRAPLGVSVTDLVLTAEQRPIVQVERLDLELGRVPQINEPFVIEVVNLHRPSIQLFQTRDGGFVGLVPFVRPNAIAQPLSVPEGQRLSDVLRLRTLRIEDGEILYYAPGATVPMTLPGIDLDLGTPRVPQAPGVYHVRGTLQRTPIFEADLDSHVNLDTGVIEVLDLTVIAELGPETYKTLPAGLQEQLQTYQARGALRMTFAGTVAASDPADWSGVLDLTLKNAEGVTGTRKLSAERVQLNVQPNEAPEVLAQGELTVENGRLVALPMLAQLVGLVRKVPLPSRLEPTDQAHAMFEVHADYIEVTSFELSTALVAARGSGRVYADGRLDLTVNAGLLEKVQSEMGALGEMFAKLTDQLVRYRVTGTLTKPELAVQPLGLGG